MDKVLDYHKDHKKWKSRLNFYKDEVKFFFKELNVVFDQNKENLARMEFIDEYEAILDKYQLKIEDLLNSIDLAEKDLYKVNIDNKIAKNHHQLHLDLLKFERSFLETKKRFKKFASQND